MEGKVEEGKDYRVGTWQGMPTYCCTRCAFDSTEWEILVRHVRGTHQVVEPVAPPLVLVADARGREVAAPVQPDLDAEPEDVVEAPAPRVRKSRNRR